MKSFNVKLNWNQSTFFKVSKYLMVIGLVGLILIDIIDIPVKRMPLPIVIAYYDVLPRWLTKSFLIPLAALVIGYAFSFVTLTTKAKLEVKSDSILIISKTKKEPNKTIFFDQIYRISIVKSYFSIFPYRIELVYFDLKCHRIIAKNLNQCVEIVEELSKVIPDRIELELLEMQSPEAIN
ncbi:MAG: hypothetical protein R2728_09850 [Chitinophagales bacterium]